MTKASHEQNDRVTSKKQLVDWFAQGGTEKNTPSIGAEHEKFIFYKDDLSAVPYEGENEHYGIKDILEYMQHNFQWNPVYEENNLIGLKKDEASITLEPGGQIELSGAPLADLHAVAKETTDHLDQLTSACDALGMDTIGLGYHPTQYIENAYDMPISRHKTLKKYFKDRNQNDALELMFSTCSTQVNLDYKNEKDMIKKLRVSLALQPIAAALFANSPFCHGKALEEQSHRSHISEDAACKRYGFMMPVAFKDDFGFEKYAEFIAGMSMIGAYHNNNFQFLDKQDISFNDCIEKENIPLKEEHPLTMNDWFNHINTIWPEVRTRQWLEMRGADVGLSAKMINALPAFWVGILYDDEALNKAYEMTKDWTDADRQYLRTESAIHGLKAEFMGTTLQEIAKNAVTLSELGLKNRNIKDSNGMDESIYIKPLKKIISTGLTQADKLKEKFNTKWGKDISKIFNEYSYGSRKKCQILKNNKRNNLKK